MKFPHLLLVVLLFGPLATLHAADSPNIVVILADDYGTGSANCLGADRKMIQTPALDRLAAEGLRFTDANTTSSVCSPTRYSLLTGRYCCNFRQRQRRRLQTGNRAIWADDGHQSGLEGER